MGINKVNIANDLCKAAVMALQSADLEGQKTYEVFNVFKTGIKKKLTEMIKVYGSDGKAWIPAASGLMKMEVTLQV